MPSPTTTARALAPAKINLTLHVTGRRADGYHDLDSLVVFADVGDWITATRAESTSLSVTGPRADGVPLDDSNRGLHIIQPDAGFAFRNGFAHNPSLGGHPAIIVPDVMAVKARLETAGVLVTDAGTFAIPGMHHIYTMDPSGNLVEINQYI